MTNEETIVQPTYIHENTTYSVIGNSDKCILAADFESPNDLLPKTFYVIPTSKDNHHEIMWKDKISFEIKTRLEPGVPSKFEHSNTEIQIKQIHASQQAYKDAITAISQFSLATNGLKIRPEFITRIRTFDPNCNSAVLTGTIPIEPAKIKKTSIPTTKTTPPKHELPINIPKDILSKEKLAKLQIEYDPTKNIDIKDPIIRNRVINEAIMTTGLSENTIDFIIQLTNAEVHMRNLSSVKNWIELIINYNLYITAMHGPDMLLGIRADYSKSANELREKYIENTRKRVINRIAVNFTNDNIEQARHLYSNTDLDTLVRINPVKYYYCDNAILDNTISKRLQK